MAFHIKSMAFNLSTENVTYYLTVMKASDLFKISKVSKANEDNEKGYQRLLNEKRAKEIAAYIDAGNIIPGSIILSAQSNAQLDFDEDNKTLTIQVIPNSFFVIDGQHRLYGIAQAKETTNIPVCILNGLTFEQEVQYFLDINSNQKGVPKSLRIELMRFLSDPNSINDLRSQLFDKMNTDKNSILRGKLNKIASTRHTLSLVPFQEALDPLLTTGVISKFKELDEKYEILNYYLLAFNKWLRKNYDNDEKLINATFFKAIFKIFPKVYELTMEYASKDNHNPFEYIIDKIQYIDFNQYVGSNNSTVIQLVEVLNSSLLAIEATQGSPKFFKKYRESNVND